MPVTTPRPTDSVRFAGVARSVTARIAAGGLVTSGLFLIVGLVAPPASATGSIASQDPITTTEPPTTTVPAPATTVAPTPPPAPAPPAPTSFELAGPDLAEGAKGADAAFLQIQLLKRGYWLSEGFGVYGASTRHAVTAFQKYMGLPRTGKVDALTRFALAGTEERPVLRAQRIGRSIEIDIARQVLLVANDGIVIVALDISSGKRSTPTPRGAFSITRQINGQRVSALGQLWRPKYFTGGYALHGSPSVPAQPASHGCVRLTNQEINFLWDSGLAPIGTPVTLY